MANIFQTKKIIKNLKSSYELITSRALKTTSRAAGWPALA